MCNVTAVQVYVREVFMCINVYMQCDCCPGVRQSRIYVYKRVYECDCCLSRCMSERLTRRGSMACTLAVLATRWELLRVTFS